jgi:hypothetical protein
MNAPHTLSPHSRYSTRALACALFACVTGCSITSATARSDAALELARNRQRWASAGIHDYEFDFQRNCFCLSEATEPVHIVVRQDVISSVVRKSDGQPASTSVSVWPRVDELFADVQQRLEQRIERLDVQYDPTYGYPRSIVADIALMSVDDEYSLTAGNLRRLP